MRIVIDGLEVIEKPVKHYSKSASRVYVPITWKKVKVVRLE